MLFLFGLLECFPYGLPYPADALLVRMRIHPPYGAAIGMFQTCGTWQNLTATTANTVTGAFERTLDAAWGKVSTGAFDYKTAVKQAVDSLADELPMVTYPSGHKDSIEVAARRAVLTGVNQTAGRLQAARQSLAEFAQATGGRVDSARTSVPKFGRSEASKASWAIRNNQSVEMSRKAGYTHQKTTPEGTKVISQATYNKLTNPIKRVGGLVLRGTPDVEEHLQKQGATALQVGDIIMFRSDATVSDVLEETHHFWQNRRGMNDDKPIDIRTALNEIDAKEHLINVAEKYKIPVEETELTKQQLEYYKKLLDELEGRK